MAAAATAAAATTRVRESSLEIGPSSFGGNSQISEVARRVLERLGLVLGPGTNWGKLLGELGSLSGVCQVHSMPSVEELQDLFGREPFFGPYAVGVLFHCMQDAQRADLQKLLGQAFPEMPLYQKFVICWAIEGCGGDCSITGFAVFVPECKKELYTKVREEPHFFVSNTRQVEFFAKVFPLNTRFLNSMEEARFILWMMMHLVDKAKKPELISQWGDILRMGIRDFESTFSGVFLNLVKNRDECGGSSMGKNIRYDQTISWNQNFRLTSFGSEEEMRRWWNSLACHEEFIQNPKEFFRNHPNTLPHIIDLARTWIALGLAEHVDALIQAGKEYFSSPQKQLFASFLGMFRSRDHGRELFLQAFREYEVRDNEAECSEEFDRLSWSMPLCMLIEIIPSITGKVWDPFYARQPESEEGRGAESVDLRRFSTKPLRSFSQTVIDRVGRSPSGKALMEQQRALQTPPKSEAS